MNDLEEHYRKLERLYIAAPTNVYYRPTISIGAGVAEIKIDVRSDYVALAVEFKGALTARGKVLHSGGRQFVVEAQLFDSDSQLVAHGTGTYVRSKLALDQDLSYV